MPHGLFISYSRRDNERGRVAALKTYIESTFRAFAGRDLQVFFDVRNIQGMDDWRQKIQHSLRESHLFLAVLSPNYLGSPYCRWEWEDYVRYEAMDDKRGVREVREHDAVSSGSSALAQYAKERDSRRLPDEDCSAENALR